MVSKSHDALEQDLLLYASLRYSLPAPLTSYLPPITLLLVLFVRSPCCYTLSEPPLSLFQVFQIIRIHRSQWLCAGPRDNTTHFFPPALVSLRTLL